MRASMRTWSSRQTSAPCKESSRRSRRGPSSLPRESCMPQIRVSPTESLPGRRVLAALRALRKGDFDARLPLDLTGVDAQISETFNDLAQFAGTLTKEVLELRRQVGREGRTHRRLTRNGARGGWADIIAA